MGYTYISIPIDSITTIRDCNISYCDLNAICVNGYTSIEHVTLKTTVGLMVVIFGEAGVDGAIVTRVMNCDFKGSLGGASGIEANNGQWIMIGNTITGLIYGIIILESTVLGEIYAPTIASNNVIKNWASLE